MRHKFSCTVHFDTRHNQILGPQIKNLIRKFHDYLKKYYHTLPLYEIERRNTVGSKSCSHYIGTVCEVSFVSVKQIFVTKSFRWTTFIVFWSRKNVLVIYC